MDGIDVIVGLGNLEDVCAGLTILHHGVCSIETGERVTLRRVELIAGAVSLRRHPRQGAVIGSMGHGRPDERVSGPWSHKEPGHAHCRTRGYTRVPGCRGEVTDGCASALGVETPPSVPGTEGCPEESESQCLARGYFRRWCFPQREISLSLIAVFSMKLLVPYKCII